MVTSFCIDNYIVIGVEHTPLAGIGFISSLAHGYMRHMLNCRYKPTDLNEASHNAFKEVIGSAVGLWTVRYFLKYGCFPQEEMPEFINMCKNMYTDADEHLKDFNAYYDSQKKMGSNDNTACYPHLKMTYELFEYLGTMTRTTHEKIYLIVTLYKRRFFKQRNTRGNPHAVCAGRTILEHGQRGLFHGKLRK